MAIWRWTCPTICSRRVTYSMLLRSVSSQVLTISKDEDSTLITRLYVEQEGGSSLLHEVGPKTKKERKS